MLESPYSVSLPLELEYEILMVALQNEVTDPLNLILVAKYIYDWLIPHIYHTMVIHPSRVYLPHVTFPSIKRHGHHTRHLLIQYEEDNQDTINTILSSCPNISKLAVWGDELGDIFESALYLKQITHLSLDLVQFKSLGFDVDALDLASDSDEDPNLVQDLIDIKEKFMTFCAQVTHLDIPADIHEIEDVGTLRYFTALAHNCLSPECPVDVLQHIVRICPRLEAIVMMACPPSEEDKLYFEGDMFEVVKGDEIEKGLDEIDAFDEGLKGKIIPVICSQPVDGWEKGARGGEDMWMLADREIGERRRKGHREKVR